MLERGVLAMKLRTLALPALAISLVACATTSPESDSATQNLAPLPPTCAGMAVGPISPTLHGQPFRGSEDFAFDGKGHIVGKKGSDIVFVDPQGNVVKTLASLPGQTWGLRFHPNGNLLAAVPGQGKVVSITPEGRVSDFATGLGQPNGVFADFRGDVFITEFGGAKVTRIAADGTRSTIASGSQIAAGANGIVVNDATHQLFYSEYSKGKIHRVNLDQPGSAPVLVAQINGASVDGIVLDQCGNIYAMDNGSARLFRVKTNPDGTAASSPELIASFPSNVANAQFGLGPGFEPESIYVTGNPGSVYKVALGVKGALVPAMPGPSTPAPEPPTVSE